MLFPIHSFNNIDWVEPSAKACAKVYYSERADTFRGQINAHKKQLVVFEIQSACENPTDYSETRRKRTQKESTPLRLKSQLTK